MIVVTISIIISILLVQGALPVFNELSGKDLSFNSNNVTFFAAALVILAIITGVVAGSYPAFYLSSFLPAEVLKGKSTLSNASGTLRQGLVVFQFVIAIALGCGMLVISKQLSYMKHKDLGFDPNAKIVIPLRTADAKKKYGSLKAAIEQLSPIKAVSAVSYPPGSTVFNDMAFYMEGGNMDNAVLNRRNYIDAGYMELLGMKLIAGRAFTSNRQAESKGNIIINRASAEKFGVEPEKMVGQKLYFDWQGKNFIFQVIGVVENYNQTSVKDPIIPIAFEIPEGHDDYSHMIASVESSAFS
jgi:putative ABC transport system permease protein